MELEVRKHYTQMTVDEKSFLNSFLTKNYYIGNHALERIKEKNINQDSIMRAIHNGSIIEWHYKNGNRLLVRGNVNENGYNICVVLNCDRGNIITVYKNSVSDNHCTLKEELYEKDFNIMSKFQLFKNNTYKKTIKNKIIEGDINGFSFS